MKACVVTTGAVIALLVVGYVWPAIENDLIFGN